MPPGPLQTFVTTVSLVPAQGGPGDTSVVPDPAANQQELPLDTAANSNTDVIIGATIGAVAGITIAAALCLYVIWRRRARKGGKGETATGSRVVWEHPAYASSESADDGLRGCVFDSVNSEQVVAAVANMDDFAADMSQGVSLMKQIAKPGDAKQAKLWDIHARADCDFVIYADAGVDAERHFATAHASLPPTENLASARRARASTQPMSAGEHDAEGIEIFPAPRQSNLVAAATQSLGCGHDDVIIVPSNS
jgi:hypothetical protein